MTKTIKTADFKPHLSLTAVKGDGEHGFLFVDGEKQWECSYCKVRGSYDELVDRNHKKFVECTEDVKPCPDCGGTPFCTPDCKGMSALLGGTDVYVAEQEGNYTECQCCHKQTTDLRYGVCFDCSDNVRVNENEGYAYAIDEPEKRWSIYGCTH